MQAYKRVLWHGTINYVIGAGLLLWVQRVMSLLVMPSWVADYSPDYAASDPAFCVCAWESSREWPKYLGLYDIFWIPSYRSWILAATALWGMNQWKEGIFPLFYFTFCSPAFLYDASFWSLSIWNHPSMFSQSGTACSNLLVVWKHLKGRDSQDLG